MTIAEPPPIALFVYGTLKRGFRMHHHIADEQFLGTVRTRPGYMLYSCGTYPGLVSEQPGVSVSGELYLVRAVTIAALDVIEDVSVTYTRRPIALENGPAAAADTYFYELSVGGLRCCGDTWA